LSEPSHRSRFGSPAAISRPSSPKPSESLLAETLAARAREAHRRPLGTLLAQTGLLRPAEIEVALARARREGKRLGEVLIEREFVSGGRRTPCRRAARPSVPRYRGVLRRPSDAWTREILRAAEFIASPEDSILAQLARVY
jgi:hypothetical protein